MPPRYSSCLCLSLLLAALHFGGHDAAFQLGSAPSTDPLLRTISLRLYGRSLDDHVNYLLDSEADAMLENPRFDASVPTVIYFHGYTEHDESESVKTVISALLRLGRMNVVLFDWSQIAAKFYVYPQLLTPEVGRLLARKLDAWHRRGALAIGDLYLVGHSLGAQVAGFVGKTVTQATVPRITGLDPAYPGFSVRAFTQGHLSPSDAEFVDVIHTDGGNFGVPYATGHADFFPNGGKRLQPACPANTRFLSDEDLCSHWKSWRYFAESLNPVLPPYYGLACDSQEDFNSGRCANNGRAVMGFFTPPSTRGSFFLETFATAPFSKGWAGLRSSGTKRRYNYRKSLLWFLG